MFSAEFENTWYFFRTQTWTQNYRTRI